VNTWNSLPNWVISANTTTYVRTDWINLGKIWKLFMIFELTWKELEVSEV